MRDPHHQQKLGIGRGRTFSRFVSTHGAQFSLRPQLCWQRDRSGNIGVDFVGRFETLDPDMSTICERLKVPFDGLPNMLKGTDEDYRRHFDERSRRLVAERYAEEIEMFGYEFN